MGADAETIGESGLYHEVEFSAQALNRGGNGGQFPIVVGTRLNDGEFKALGVIEREEAGDSIELSRTHRLGIGRHRLEFIVGDLAESVEISVEAADLALELLPLRIERPGLAYLPAVISNNGDAPAKNIRVTGSWKPRPWNWYLGNEFDVYVAALGPGASHRVEARVPIPHGQFTFRAAVSSASLESDPSNNQAELAATVTDDRLVLDAIQVPQFVYEGERANAQFEYYVANLGDGESASVWAGLVLRESIERFDQFPTEISGLPQCPGELTAGCWWGAEQLRIGPGESRRLVVWAPLGIGEHRLIAFVGGPGYGSRPENDFYQELRVNVTPQPATQLYATLGSSVRGYWSDGTASVDLSAAIGNSGYQELRAELPARLLCRSQIDGAQLCDFTIATRLENGFGPGQIATVARVPAGVPVSVDLEIQGQVVAASTITVPPKILGVKRFIWDCYSARTSYAGRNPTVRLDCSGWGDPIVQKWWQEGPVKVWATGPERYQTVLRNILAELAPLLNLSFEYVDSEHAAQFKAWVGVPESLSTQIWGGTFCAHQAGCATDNADQVTGIADSAMISAWGEQWWSWDLATEVISHEALHALASVGHRFTPDHMMRFPLSSTDRMLLELNSHPLVRPGMRMEQVRNVIVLEDELLDGRAPGPLEILWRAGEASSSPGSASFQLTGEWSGSACRFDSYGPIQYRLSDMSHDESELVHVVSGQHQYWLLDDRYLTWEDGTWQPLSEYGVQTESGWLHELTDPLPLLRWSALRGAAADFGIVDLGDGLINLVADAVPASEGIAPIYDVRITIEPGSYRILGYQMTRSAADGCQLRVTAEGGSYGQGLEPPPEPA
ncbi:MAG: hypothetical protein F4Y46_03240 [Chloroflexi bacterium]|nr:hypothetical protein [Chloroflexota bacterium]